MLKILNNMVTNDELIFLNSLCFSFTSTDTKPTKGSSYIRKNLNIETDLLEYQKRCKESIGDKYELFGMWINKVTTETNIDDVYHYDRSDLTIVTYINDTFDGGEFEYIENKNVFKIKPIINMSLVMDNKLLHRVLKITKNERFSLISFYKWKEKNKKTLI